MYIYVSQLLHRSYTVSKLYTHKKCHAKNVVIAKAWGNAGVCRRWFTRYSAICKNITVQWIILWHLPKQCASSTPMMYMCILLIYQYTIQTNHRNWDSHHHSFETLWWIWYTLQGTNISPPKGTVEGDFHFPKVEYASSLEGNSWDFS